MFVVSSWNWVVIWFIGVFSCWPYMMAMLIGFLVFSFIHFVSDWGFRSSMSSVMFIMSFLMRKPIPPPSLLLRSLPLHSYPGMLIVSPLARWVSVIPAM